MVAHLHEHSELANRLKCATKPAWVWDPVAMRVLWANDLGLARNGVKSLPELTRLRFASDTIWVKTLTRRAKTLEKKGAEVALEFIPGDKQVCLLEPIDLDDETTAIIITWLDKKTVTRRRKKTATESKTQKPQRQKTGQKKGQKTGKKADEKTANPAKNKNNSPKSTAKSNGGTSDSKKSGPQTRVKTSDEPVAQNKKSTQFVRWPERSKPYNYEDEMTLASIAQQIRLETGDNTGRRVRKSGDRVATSAPLSMDDPFSKSDKDTNTKVSGPNENRTDAHATGPQDSIFDVKYSVRPKSSAPQKPGPSLQHIIDALPVPALTCNQTGEISAVNAHFSHEYGVNPGADLQPVLPRLQIARLLQEAKNEKKQLDHILIRSRSGYESDIDLAVQYQHQASTDLCMDVYLMLLYPTEQNTHGSSWGSGRGLNQDLNREVDQGWNQGLSQPEQTPSSYHQASYHEVIPAQFSSRLTDENARQENRYAPSANPALNAPVKIPHLAKAGHEIRTPLNSIIGFAELIQSQKFGPVNNAKYLDYINDIHDSARHALLLINDMLDMNRLESGQWELGRENVQIGHLVHTCLRSLTPQLSEKHIRVDTGFIDANASVSGDERAIRQVLLNVIANAIKYSPMGAHIKVQSHLMADKLAISIENSGVSLSVHEIEKAMQPFGRTGQGSPGVQGSGLGLPLSKSIMHSMKGDLYLTSRNNPQTGEGYVTAHLIFPVS